MGRRRTHRPTGPTHWEIELRSLVLYEAQPVPSSTASGDIREFTS